MTETAPVYVWLPQKATPIEAGVFTWEAPSGPGVFAYHSAAIRDFRSRPLDPMRLLANGREQKQVRQNGVFGVFRDSAPDGWGERQLKRRYKLDAIDPFQRLTLGSTNGAGCIAVGELSSERAANPTWTLPAFQQAAAEWASGRLTLSDPSFQEFLLVAAPPITTGGMKPKVEVEHEGALWIMKFPDPGDPRDFPSIEGAALSLAEMCGIETPSHFVVNAGHGERTIRGLMIKRFDRIRIDSGYARRGFASAHTVMDLDHGLEESDLRSYINFAHEAARWCARGTDKEAGIRTRREVWRRVVFNALISNIDDHSRNHGLVCDDGIWRLSPIFDVVPVAPGARRYLTLPFAKGAEGNIVSRERLIACCGIYKWETAEANDELRRMAAIVSSNWRRVMLGHGATEETLERRAAAFDVATEIAARA